MLIFEDDKQQEKFELVVEEVLSDFRDNLTLDNIDAKKEYDSWLDDLSDSIKIGDIEFTPSYVLERLDPVSYRCGFCDWQDGLTYTDIISLFDDVVDDILSQLNELGFDVTEDELKEFVEENY